MLNRVLELKGSHEPHGVGAALSLYPPQGASSGPIPFSVCLSRWSQSLWSVFVSITVGASLVSSLEGVGESQSTADCWEMVF